MESAWCMHGYMVPMQLSLSDRVDGRVDADRPYDNITSTLLSVTLESCILEPGFRPSVGKALGALNRLHLPMIWSLRTLFSL
jgi:hypothetical protein